MASSMALCRSQFPRPANILVVTILTFTILVGSAAAVSAPPPQTTPKPIVVYPSCKKTLMPKRCSVRLSALSKSLAEAKEVLAGPKLAGKQLKSDPCVVECTKVVDAAASNATTALAGGEDALARLKGYLYPLYIYNDGPIGPCACHCTGEKCGSADEDMAVQKMGDASGAMQAMANLFQTFADEEDADENSNKEEFASMEKSIDSGVLHVSCGLTREPQKCVDELSALAKTTRHDADMAWEMMTSDAEVKAKLGSAIMNCSYATKDLLEQLDFAEAAVKSLQEIRGAIHSKMQGDGKQPPRCKCSCPPPPEKPCSANETAVVNKLNGVYDAWVAGEKFLTELLSPN